MDNKEGLISYYNSKDKDVTLGRRLVDRLSALGVTLSNEAKNTIIKDMQGAYSSGSYHGMARTATMLKQVADNHNEQLPKAVSQYIEEYEAGVFEDCEAFDRNKERISKDEYYISIADAVLRRSTCLRRRYGAVLVKNDEIIATGYNGSPRGETNCIERGFCDRESLNIPKGERYEMCLAVHAEQNAIISASRQDTIGSTLYISGREVKTWEHANPQPCAICARMIKNAGITRVVGIYKGEIIECKI